MEKKLSDNDGFIMVQKKSKKKKQKPLAQIEVIVRKDSNEKQLLNDNKKNSNLFYEEKIFSRFYEFLNKSGPLHFKSPELLQEYEKLDSHSKDLINSRGSLVWFLCKNKNFGSIDDYICVINHLKTTKDLVLDKIIHDLNNPNSKIVAEELPTRKQDNNPWNKSNLFESCGNSNNSQSNINPLMERREENTSKGVIGSAVQSQSSKITKPTSSSNSYSLYNSAKDLSKRDETIPSKGVIRSFAISQNNQFIEPDIYTNKGFGAFGNEVFGDFKTSREQPVPPSSSCDQNSDPNDTYDDTLKLIEVLKRVNNHLINELKEKDITIFDLENQVKDLKDQCYQLTSSNMELKKDLESQSNYDLCSGDPSQTQSQNIELLSSQLTDSSNSVVEQNNTPSEIQSQFTSNKSNENNSNSKDENTKFTISSSSNSSLASTSSQGLLKTDSNNDLEEFLKSIL